MTLARSGRFALAAILLFAAWSRFVGIDHHLRRAGADFDEANNFVEPVLRMWSQPTLDPTVYTGYPGFFNWLAFLPIGAGQKWGGEVGAFVAGRALTAAASVLSVWLAYALVGRLAGAYAGLLAAALLALSRGEIRAAHYITPDTLVAAAALGVLLLAARRGDAPPGPGTRFAASLGALLGGTLAVKYTGLFLAPGVAVALLPGPRRWRRFVVAAAAAAVVFFVAAPYAVLRMGGSDAIGGGFTRALADYFGSGHASNRAGAVSSGSMAGVSWLLYVNLGAAGIASALAGALLHRPWRAALPAIAIAAAGFAAMAPAKLVYPRHVLSVSAACSVLAALGVAAAMRLVPALRSKAAAAGLAALVLAQPAVDGVRLAVRYARTPAIDAAAAYVEALEDAPPLVGTTLPRLRLDSERFEVRAAGRGTPRDVLSQYQLLVVPPEDAGDWPVVARFGGVDEEQPLVVARPRPGRLRQQPLRWLRDAAGGVWQSASDAPFTVTRIEVDAEAVALRSMTIEALLPGKTDFAPLSVWPLRPGRLSRLRPGAPLGQSWAVSPPATVAALRIGSAAGTVSEVRAYFFSNLSDAEFMQ